ncbi:aldolase/citrate lyase family protein [Paraburkholderia nemoris]|uniref:HpcH/HpaI aldolase family protein n=1 Tax=Paraburkholderia nemoris TaxID=2793076 RepID=UPI0038BC2E6E
MNDSFRSRLQARELLIGTFVKSTDHTVTEVLCRSGLDVLCLDAEHVPFGSARMDTCLLAARAHQMPTIVRVADDSPHALLAALDMGATAVQVPHVTSASTAERIAKACRFAGEGPGRRGYAGSTRAAGYGTKPMAQHLLDSDSNIAVIAQIEDAAALAELPQLLQVEGIDAFFIGRVDLAVSLGANRIDDPMVEAAINIICASCREAGKSVGIFCSDATEIEKWRANGASLFLVGSDHSFMLRGAKELALSVREGK